MKFDFKEIFDKIKWHLLAIGIFFVVASIFYYPALQGYKLKQDDVTNFIGMSQEIVDYRLENDEDPLWTNAMFSGMPATQISVRYEGQGFLSFVTSMFQLWLPRPLGYMFVFFLSFYFMSLCFKVKHLTAIVGAIAFGLSSYFLIIIDVGHNSKALTMAFTPFLIGSFILAFKDKTRLIGIGLSMLFMAIQFRLNHVQITYYILFIIAAIGIVYLINAIKEKSLKPYFISVAGIIVAYLIGFGANYGNMLGTLEYAPHTIRGASELTINPDGSSNADTETSGLDRDYVTNWSYGVGETFTFLVPDFKGGGSIPFGNIKSAETELNKITQPELKQHIAENMRSYYGEQPGTSGPVYVGAIILFLSVLAIVYVRRPIIWALFGVTILTVMLSWGKNFPFLTNLFLDYFPSYNKFRAVTIILVVAELTIPLLGVFFLKYLIDKKEEIQNNIKPFLIVSGSFVLILLAMWFVPFTDFISSAEVGMLASVPQEQSEIYNNLFSHVKDIRKSIYTSSVLRSLAFIVIAIGLIYGYIKMNLKPTYLLIGLGVFIFLDLALYGFNFADNSKENGEYVKWGKPYQIDYPYDELRADSQILQAELQEDPKLGQYISGKIDSLQGVWRSENLDPQERTRKLTWWKYRLLNRKTNFRVYDQYGNYNNSRASYFYKSIGGYHGAKLGRYQDLISFHLGRWNMKVFDMLNTKYFFNWDANSKTDVSSMTRRNTNLGNAWLVSNIDFVESADDEILALGSIYQINIKDASGLDLRLNGEPFQSGKVYQNQNLATWNIQTNPETKLMDTLKAPINLSLQGKEGDKFLYARSKGGKKWQRLSKENMPNAMVLVQVINQDSLFMQVNKGNFFVNGQPFEQGVISPRSQLSEVTVTETDTILSIVPMQIPLQPNTQMGYFNTNGQLGWLPESASVNAEAVILEAEIVSEFEPRKEAIVNNAFKENVTQETYDASGQIEMISYAPNELKYKVNNKDKGFAVFSEIYYPLGWKAYIDGEEVDIVQVNYALRGLEIPAGEHEIVFKYELASYATATTMSIAGSIVMILILLVIAFVEFKKYKKISPKENE